MRTIRLSTLAVVFFAVSVHATADPIRPVLLVAGQSDTLYVADLVPLGEPVFTDGDHVGVEQSRGRLVFTPDLNFEGLSLVPFTLDGQAGAVPVRVRRKVMHTLTYPDDGSAQQVFTIGQFNDWSRTSHPLERDGEGQWTITLSLDPGRYEYKFTVDGEEVLDPGNPVRVPNPFGDFNNILNIPSRHAERLVLHPVGFGDGVMEFAAESGGRPVDVAELRLLALVDNRPVGDEHIEAHGDRILVRTNTLGDGRLRIALDDDGNASRFASVDLREGAPLSADTFTWRDAVIYQIMIDRFLDGDPSNTRPVPHDSVAARANYHGGDLAGVLQKLREGYFDDLGVNVLWLSPVNQNTERAHREYPPPHRFYTGYHGYWPTHPTQVDHRFGDMDLLRTLTAEAEAGGIRVLLDLVANHVHEDHPFFQQNREWFGTLDLPDGRKNLRLWDEHRLTTWFEPYLPSFDFEGSPEAVEVMTANAVWWLRESGAHGFRHDAVKHIPNHFWRILTRMIREEINPVRELPAYQIGETFGSYDLISSYVKPGQLDAQFNFNLYDAALYAFLDPDASFSVLDEEMQRTLDVYGPDHLMGNLMDSHDKPRFPALVEGHVPGPDGDDKEIGWHTDIRVEHPETYGRVELYLAYLLTTPGIPTIYYGNEIGKTGANDPDNRRPMRFGAELSPLEKDLRERVATLIHLRGQLPALRRGDFHTLASDHDTWTYLRTHGEGHVLISLNKGEEEQVVEVSLPAALAAERARDMIGGHDYATASGQLFIRVPAGGYRILLLE